MTFLAGGLFDDLGGGDMVKIVAIVLGCSTGMVAIIATAVARSVRAKAREEARREIAAYVAEGSIDPDKAVALLNAGSDIKALEDVVKEALGT